MASIYLNKTGIHLPKDAVVFFTQSCKCKIHPKFGRQNAFSLGSLNTYDRFYTNEFLSNQLLVFRASISLFKVASIYLPKIFMDIYIHFSCPVLIYLHVLRPAFIS